MQHKCPGSNWSATSVTLSVKLGGGTAVESSQALNWDTSIPMNLSLSLSLVKTLSSSSPTSSSSAWPSSRSASLDKSVENCRAHGVAAFSIILSPTKPAGMPISFSPFKCPNTEASTSPWSHGNSAHFWYQRILLITSSVEQDASFQ